MKPAHRLASIAVLLALFGQGCMIGQKPQGPPTGGMWFSPDRGTSWKQKTVVLSSMGIGTNNMVDVVDMAMDPQDSNALYLGTQANGLYYSYDKGDSWLKPKDVLDGLVSAVVVHPKQKCVIFIAHNDRVKRSEDCSRSFQATNLYLENKEPLANLIVDWFNPEIMYAAAQQGRLFKSFDGGKSWAVTHKFEGNISDIAMDAKDSRVMLVGLQFGGMWKTSDGGQTWVSLKENTKSIEGYNAISKVTADPSTGGRFLVGGKMGLMETRDAGATWRVIPLLTPPAETRMSSLAVDKTNPDKIYFGTNRALYRTANSGANWEAIQLPTARSASNIIINPSMPDEVFLTARQANQ